jgi:hypothetical protein
MTVASAGLMILGCISNQAPTTPKVGKPLVRCLPPSTEGVELAGGTVRAKSGYKFVKRPDGSVTVARMAGGGTGVSFSCHCQAEGTCTVVIHIDAIYCQSMCSGVCRLAIYPKAGPAIPIIAY